MRLIAACLALALLAACGIKGDPVPPDGAVDDYPGFEAADR
jgi:predicted small lipoprotein YifL